LLRRHAREEEELADMSLAKVDDDPRLALVF